MDFSRLDKITLFDAYPMPRVDVLLDKIAGAQVLPTINLTKGYWQILLAKEAHPKIAFATPSGLCQFTKLPFGLHGDVASFKRVMDRALKPVQDCAVAYIDDILIFSPSWEAHIKHLCRVLTALCGTALA